MPNYTGVNGPQYGVTGYPQGTVPPRQSIHAGFNPLWSKNSSYTGGQAMPVVSPVNGYGAPPPRDLCMARSRDRHQPTGTVPNPARHPHSDTAQRQANGQATARKQAEATEEHPLRRKRFRLSPSLLSRLAASHLDRTIRATEHSRGVPRTCRCGHAPTVSVTTGRRGTQGQRPRRRGSPRTHRRYRGQLNQRSERRVPPP